MHTQKRTTVVPTGYRDVFALLVSSSLTSQQFVNNLIKTLLERVGKQHILLTR
jgi:hypothetical protein